METVVLEKTIIKLGTLLAIGLGQAGANIIGQNMKGSGTAHEKFYLISFWKNMLASYSYVPRKCDSHFDPL